MIAVLFLMTAIAFEMAKAGGVLVEGCEGMGPTRYFSDLFGWLRDLWP